MYIDMNAKETMTLEQLAVANPDLFSNMRTAAETKINGPLGSGGAEDSKKLLRLVNNSVTMP
jgi:hypothetical protein